MNKQQKKANSIYCVMTNRLDIEYIEVDKPRSMPNFHYHNKYELYYLRSGARYYFIKDYTYAVNPGCFVLVNKNDIHCTGTLNDAAYERFVLYFDENYIKDALSDVDTEDLSSLFKMDIGTIEISPKKRPLVESILFSMLEYSQKNDDKEKLYFKAALIHLLLIIQESINNQVKRELCEIGTTHKTASKIIGYINNNFSEEITLASLSEKFYISPYYLSRTFKRVCEISFIDYLNNVRIKEAKKLLTSTKLSITEVGEAVGYKSTTHFGRVFKNLTGISPLSYRKKH